MSVRIVCLARRMHEERLGLTRASFEYNPLAYPGFFQQMVPDARRAPVAQETQELNHVLSLLTRRRFEQDMH